MYFSVSQFAHKPTMRHAPNYKANRWNAIFWLITVIFWLIKIGTSITFEFLRCTQMIYQLLIDISLWRKRRLSVTAIFNLSQPVFRRFVEFGQESADSVVSSFCFLFPSHFFRSRQLLRFRWQRFAQLAPPNRRINERVDHSMRKHERNEEKSKNAAGNRADTTIDWNAVNWMSLKTKHR